MTKPDALVMNEGSIVLFRLLTHVAQDWWDDHVQADAMQHGQSYVVEHRYAPHIASHMMQDGLQLNIQ